jgi:hypothetical protein
VEPEKNLKASIVEPEKTFIASQRLDKHVPAAINKHKMVEELLEVVRQKNMIMSPMGPRTKNDCAGKNQQQNTQLIDQQLHDSQSRETEKYSYESCETQNQE